VRRSGRKRGGFLLFVLLLLVLLGTPHSGKIKSKSKTKSKNHTDKAPQKKKNAWARCSGPRHPNGALLVIFSFPGGRSPRLEDEPQADARGPEVQVALAEAVAEVGPAAVHVDAHLVRHDAVLEPHAHVAARPAVAIGFITAAGVDVGRHADAIEREANDD